MGKMELLLCIMHPFWIKIFWELLNELCHAFLFNAVRCLIMQSFLGIDWRNYVPCLMSLPQTFIIGPFIEALNDPVQHKDFGQSTIYLCPLGYHHAYVCFNLLCWIEGFLLCQTK